MMEQAVSLGRKGIQIYLHARQVHVLVNGLCTALFPLEKRRVTLKSELSTDVPPAGHQSEQKLEF
jgi:hypothetical protein